MIPTRLRSCIVAIEVGTLIFGAPARADDDIQASNIFAQLHGLPVPPEKPLDLTNALKGQPARRSTAVAHEKSDVEEMTVFANPKIDFESLNTQDYQKLVSTFGPVIKPFDQNFNNKFNVKYGPIGLSAAGITLWGRTIGFNGPPPQNWQELAK